MQSKDAVVANIAHAIWRDPGIVPTVAPGPRDHLVMNDDSVKEIGISERDAQVVVSVVGERNQSLMVATAGLRDGSESCRQVNPTAHMMFSELDQLLLDGVERPPFGARALDCDHCDNDVVFRPAALGFGFKDGIAPRLRSIDVAGSEVAQWSGWNGCNVTLFPSLALQVKAMPCDGTCRLPSDIPPAWIRTLLDSTSQIAQC